MIATANGPLTPRSLRIRRPTCVPGDEVPTVYWMVSAHELSKNAKCLTKRVQKLERRGRKFAEKQREKIASFESAAETANRGDRSPGWCVQECWSHANGSILRRTFPPELGTLTWFYRAGTRGYPTTWFQIWSQATNSLARRTDQRGHRSSWSRRLEKTCRPSQFVQASDVIASRPEFTANSVRPAESGTSVVVGIRVLWMPRLGL